MLKNIYYVSIGSKIQTWLSYYIMVALFLTKFNTNFLGSEL